MIFELVAVAVLILAFLVALLTSSLLCFITSLCLIIFDFRQWNGALDIFEGRWEYHLKGLVQDFVDGVVKSENMVVDFCAGMVGLFAW